MGYNYGYDGLGLTTGLDSALSKGVGSMIWLIIAFVLSFIGCFVVYFLFVKKDGKPANKVLAWLKGFLRFDKMLIETILKIAYIFVALFITLGSFAVIGINFLSFLSILIVGNLVARVMYELSMIMIMIWKNTAEIKDKLK